MASTPGSVTIGGKGSSLSPAAVYAISRGLSTARIDSAAIDRLSSLSKKPHNPKPEAASSTSTSPRLLNLEESRAALVVLLNKLLLSDAAVRPALPVLIEKTLALESGHEVVDFGSAQGLLSSLCQLNGQTVDEVGFGREEINVFEGSCAALGAICAILDCCFSALVKVADAVAALSCEATRADIAVYDSFSSGDGFSNKDETDVAADMKMLLFGSKLVGQKDLVAFREIPTVNGRFRKAVKWLHDQTRVELNSVIKAKKTTGGGNHAKEQDFVDSIIPLVMSIRSVSKSSICRAKSIIEAHGDVNRRSKVAELFDKGCPSLDTLMEQLLLVTDKALSGSDDTAVVQGVYLLLVKLREVLAWEAAVALYAIEMDDSIEKPQAELVKPNGEASKADKKSEKKKKKTLGKGTSIIWLLLTNRTVSKHLPSSDNVAVVLDWAQELSTYFDPKDTGLDTFMTKMKEIVESNEVRRLPKIPKGTRDFGKEQMAIRELAFSIITGVFKMHGAVALDTPVFELRETLMGKYGEDSKLIYDLADQGGELCSLRYDLTVPFARYLAMNGITSLKRYQIAKVYRRDNPSKGRYREFYQCDFDIAGNYELMEPDFEVLTVLTQLLDRLNIGSYEIKLNHRKLLDGMLEICGVPSEKFRTVCSSIDKLDKQPFVQIRKELVEEKGLAGETADKIGTLVMKRGPPLEILQELKSEGSPFLQSSGSVIALNELEILFKTLQKANSLDNIIFDLSLARGLDYYTGVIFEAVFKGTTQVGSIAAGGRYDNLVGMFSGKQVPAVGVSLGIERVFAIMEQLERNQGIRATETEVLVAILGKDLQLAAPILDVLWKANIKTEFGLSKRVMTHISRAIDSGIPFMVIVGESEVQSGIFKLKSVKDNKEEEVPRDRIVEVLKEKLTR